MFDEYVKFGEIRYKLEKNNNFLTCRTAVKKQERVIGKWSCIEKENSQKCKKNYLKVEALMPFLKESFRKALLISLDEYLREVLFDEI